MHVPVLINKFGKISGWNDIRVVIFGRTLEGIVKVEYNDNIDWSNEYGAGGAPIGESDGNYSATASIELYEEEKRAILDSLPPGMILQKIPPFTMTVMYDYNGKIYTDKVKNCRFKSAGNSSSQGQKKHTHNHELKTSHIAWNGIDPII